MFKQIRHSRQAVCGEDLGDIVLSRQQGLGLRGAAVGGQQHVAVLQVVVAEAQPARLLSCQQVLQGVNLHRHNMHSEMRYTAC